MAPNAFLVDGLWLCLRPSFSRLVITSRTRPLRNNPCQFYCLNTFSRPVSSSANVHHQSGEHPPRRKESPPEESKFFLQEEEDPFFKDDASEVLDVNPSVLPKAQSHGVTRPKRPAKKLPSEPEEVYEARIKMRRRNVAPDSELQTKSTEALENILQAVVKDRPNHTATLRVIRELIERRHIKPQVQHYRAMMLANADSSQGSAVHVKGILEEMEDVGIPADSGALHAALRV